MNDLQNLKDIAPMADKPKGSSEPVDPIAADYDEGKRFIGNGNLSQAAMSLHNALLGYEEKGDKAGIANASNQLGHVCLAKNDFVGAENHYQRAWDLCEELGDPMSLFELNKRFVQVNRGLKNYDKAIKLCFDILDVYQGNNDPRGTVGILETLAEVYIDADSAEKAADTFRTIASIHRNFKHESIADTFEQKAKDILKG